MYIIHSEKTKQLIGYKKAFQRNIIMFAYKAFLFQTQKSNSVFIAENFFGELPKTSEIKELTSDYCIFITLENKSQGLGLQTIRFKVDACYLEGEPDDDRGNDFSPSEVTLAMRHDNKIVILEGRHRAIHAFQGGVVLPGLGGVSGKPNILEYTFDPDEASYGFFTKIIPIDEFRNYLNPYTYDTASSLKKA